MNDCVPSAASYTIAPHTHHSHHGQLDRGVRGNDEVVVDDESGFGVLPSIVGGGGRGD